MADSDDEMFGDASTAPPQAAAPGAAGTPTSTLTMSSTIAATKVNGNSSEEGDEYSESDSDSGPAVLLDEEQAEKQAALQAGTQSLISGGGGRPHAHQGGSMLPPANRAAGTGAASSAAASSVSSAGAAGGAAFGASNTMTAFSIPRKLGDLSSVGGSRSRNGTAAGAAGSAAGDGREAREGLDTNGKGEDYLGPGQARRSLIDIGPEPLVGQDGQNSFDIDIEGLEERPWTKPGADVSDYFNYGFTEETWKAYCGKQVALRLEASMQAPIRVFESAAPMAELPPELQAVATTSAFRPPDRSNPAVPELGGGRIDRQPRPRDMEDVVELAGGKSEGEHSTEDQAQAEHQSGSGSRKRRRSSGEEAELPAVDAQAEDEAEDKDRKASPDKRHRA